MTSLQLLESSEFYFENNRYWELLSLRWEFTGFQLDFNLAAMIDYPNLLLFLEAVNKRQDMSLTFTPVNLVCPNFLYNKRTIEENVLFFSSRKHVDFAEVL